MYSFILCLAAAATLLSIGILLTGTVRRRRTKPALESRVGFESLILELSSRFARVPIDRIDGEIAYAVAQLPNYLPTIDRVSVLECPPNATDLLLTRPNVDVWGTTVPFGADDLERYTPRTWSNQEEAAKVRPRSDGANAPTSILRCHRTGSSLSVPMEDSGSVVGVLVFTSSYRGSDWSGTMLEHSRMLGQVFAGALSRKRADHVLTVSQQIRDLILSFGGLHLVLLDREGTVMALRNHCQGPRLPSIAVGDCYIDAFARAAGPHSRPAVRVSDGVRAILSGERTQFQMEYSYEYEGRQSWLAITVMPLANANKVVVVMHRDISKEKSSEQALRELGGKLIRAQEEERSRIARELHDDISQRLALLTVELRRVQDIAPHCIDVEVSGLCRKVDEITADIHGLSRCLHSSQLQLLGLGSALRGLCTECSRQSNIKIECFCAGLPSRVDPEVSLSLFRVAQEALNNVVKHSHAQHAQVELACMGTDLSLRISDDGWGFTRNHVPQSSLGLVSMRERIHVVDGTLTISSTPRSGTQIEARVPFKKRAQSEDNALGSAA